MKSTYDFCGWATKNDIRCTDGRTIRKDAFKDCDGMTVPMVWNHQHNSVENVLGHATLKNDTDGVKAFCTFNDSEAGKTAKLLVLHGDVNALSICANQVKEIGSDVVHGTIREVSLVLAGANPGARIEEVMMHGDLVPNEFIIYSGEELSLEHSNDDEPETLNEPEVKESGSDDETVEDVLNTLTDKQKTAMNAMIGAALESANTDIADNPEGGDEMKHNVFDPEKKNNDDKTLQHSEELAAALSEGKRYGSLKESMLQHGIDNLEYLFPEDHLLDTPPAFISRKMGWVKDVMDGVHHTPFAHVKSMFADITEDDARAKGYIKGNFKKEEVFSLLKRSTGPTTVYKKQRMDRDDQLDITDFDVIPWLKTEMRTMLDEELARAFLIGDGRLSSSDDKIKPDCIRPIAFDDDLFTIKVVVDAGTNPTPDQKTKAIIRSIIKARKDYKGSGNPVFYTTEDVLTDMLLLEDANGRDIYDDEAKLAKKLRVSKIVTVPVMEGLKGKNGGDFIGLIVNLSDYNVGADKGGSVNMFDDFDIDYNAQKYLIETRCSGALTRPFSAMAIEMKKS